MELKSIIFVLIFVIFSTIFQTGETSICLELSNIWSTFNPSKPSDGNIYFTFYKTAEEYQQYLVNQSEQIELDPTKNTVFYIAGYRTSNTSDYIKSMAANYASRDNYNFIYVDVTKFLFFEYTHLSSIVEDIGSVVALGIKKMGIPHYKIHLIGFSIGAHIAGNAGIQYSKNTHNKMERITGLDPAGPCFGLKSDFTRLSVECAKFVDVIHSNVGMLGIETPIGHADFYPAGLRRIQPKCVTNTCSHGRSVEYYIDTIKLGNERIFIGVKCETFKDLKKMSCSNDRTPMGFAAENTAAGIYYVDVVG